jgi:hypothetical protein
MGRTCSNFARGGRWRQTQTASSSSLTDGAKGAGVDVLLVGRGGEIERTGLL